MPHYKTSILIVIVSVAFLILFVACKNNEVIADAPNETVVQRFAEKQLCENVDCGQNKQCLKGSCACVPGFKKCSDACIPDSACCDAADCRDVGKFCGDDTACHLLARECSFNAVWNVQSESCECINSTKFCDSQNKCIPSNNCCTITDCTFRRDICASTKYVASICINDGTQHCKGTIEGQQGLFMLKNGSIKVFLKNILQDGKATVLINGNSNTLLPGRPLMLGEKTTIILEQIKPAGGVCKTYLEKGD